MDRRRVRPLALLSALCLAAAVAPAEQLPLKIYTTAEGLPSDRIERILVDSHGFLWFGTGDGLSRFDGYGFRNYGPSDGMPPGPISALIESRDGTYWVGTGLGLARFDASREPSRSGASLRVLHAPGAGAADDIEALLEDRSGVLWLGTRAGLFRVPGGPESKVEAVALDTPGLTGAPAIHALLEDRNGNLWMGAESGLYRRSPAGAIQRVAGADGLPVEIRCMTLDRSGSLWVGTRANGLFEIPLDHGAALNPRSAFTRANGLAGEGVVQVLETGDRKLWATCYGGLSEIAADRASIRTYTAAEGLAALGMWSLAEDRNGNLWIGSDDAGVMRLARDGFRRFDARDGLTSLRVGALFANLDGFPCALTRGQRPEDIARGDGFLECFDGRRFHTRSPRLPAGTSYGWGWDRLPLRDPGGEWWVPTFSGLFRFPAVPFERLGETSSSRVYTRRDGLPSDAIYRLGEDSLGNLWIALANTDRPLARWDRATGAVRTFSCADGIPATLPMAFAQGADGATWIGFFGGGLARHRQGKIAFFGEKDGLPPGSIRALHADRKGRLWIATGRSGLARIERPAEAVPRFETLGRAEGLSSDNTWSLAEDREGRIYVGTERGLDRVDPSTGNVQRYTTDDGLARGVIETSITDGRGDLWFGSVEGLSRLVPAAQSRTLAPPIRISGVVVNGLVEPLPDIGAPEVRIAGRSPEPTSLEIRFVALDFAPGGRPEYQYRVDGIDREWSAPTAQRSVVYARLPSGRYRFRVRSIAGEGLIGSSEAVVDFAVRPPFWKRPEVLAAAALVLVAIAYAFHRSRLKNALAVERVRTRVASDLHDDVGSGLSEIAILSELANQGGAGEPPTRILREIGDAARGLVDSMGDIVWSTDPRKDDVASLVQRLRHFAANTLESRGIAWSLEIPAEFEARTLDPDRRKQMFLILKEALTNVARHSHCRNARVRIRPAAREVVIEIEDDGTGFAPAAAAAAEGGHGLANMRARADAAGGQFHLESSPASGTRIRVRLPLSRSA